jgi:predicted O-methyltransferase YrrM
VERILRKLAHWNISQATPEEVTQRLDDPFRSLLCSMYRGERQEGTDGRLHPLDALVRIAPFEGMWLYDLCRRVKPLRTLEIGLAYGFSTLFFLAAIRANDHGIHWAVDPGQTDLWHGIGVRRAQLVGMKHAFRFIEEKSVRALPDFTREGLAFDVIFVDGAHYFDSALVDFVLAADLCQVGGYIIFDDLWLPPIRKVVSFVRANRTEFTEVDRPWRRLWSRWSLRAPGNIVREVSVANVAVFQKTGGDRRDWRHFVDFR